MVGQWWGMPGSAVPRITTFRLFLALVLMFNLTEVCFKYGDVPVAFLNALVDEDIFVLRAPACMNLAPGFVLQLIKAVYGIKQAPYLWNEEINRSLLEVGLLRSILDPCLYFRISESLVTILIIYVDDICLASNDRTLAAKIEKDVA